LRNCLYLKMPRKHEYGAAAKTPAFLLMVILLSMCGSVRAKADAAFLMEEPFGGFGSINPTGHAAVYLNHVCAETPIRLRICRPGEAGAVVSRYHKINGYDWIAMPLLPYLYAVDRVEDVPESADAALRARLRDEYRRKHLREIVPDVTSGEIPEGEWIQLVGSSYDRKIYGFQIETMQEQDESFIARFNDRRNVSHFNLFFHNCADFSRNVLNMFYPHAVRRNYLVDVGMTTPKQVARSLTKYARRHPDLAFSTFVIPQVPGGIPRSRSINGVVEALVKSKKYVVPLAVLHPEVTAVMVVTYFTKGRFTPAEGTVQVMVPGDDARALAEAREASVDLQAGVDVNNQSLSLDEHGVELEGGKGERVAGSLGGATE
jgi:hypothetical protein